MFICVSIQEDKTFTTLQSSTTLNNSLDLERLRLSTCTLWSRYHPLFRLNNTKMSCPSGRSFLRPFDRDRNPTRRPLSSEPPGTRGT